MQHRINSSETRKEAKRKKEKISKKSTRPRYKSRYVHFRSTVQYFRWINSLMKFSMIFLANRESAFINALIASGSTYEITKACHKGELKDCNQCSEGEDLKKYLKPEDQALKSNSQVEQLWEYCDVPLGWFSN